MITKNITFKTPIFVSLNGQKEETLGYISNGAVTDSDGNIWIKTGNNLHHIEDLVPESRSYILNKLKENGDI